MNTYEQVVKKIACRQCPALEHDGKCQCESSSYCEKRISLAKIDIATVFIVNGKTYRLAIVEDEAGLPINPYQVEANRKWQAMEPNGYDRGVTDMLRAGFVKELKEGE
jgi:hypothetical protein